MAFARRGCTATVVVLIVLALGTGVYAAVLRPHTAIPSPGLSSSTLMFGPAHHARSPITAQQVMSVGPADQPNDTVNLGITLVGDDLRYPGWRLIASVPPGVRIVGWLPDDSRPVFRNMAGGTFVVVTPGPVRARAYSVLLTWNGLDSGPLRVQGANLVAAFPNLTVANQAPSAPTLTVSRLLQPNRSDYAYLGGPLPDHQDSDSWSWKPQTGVGAEFLTLVPPLTVEARSVVTDEEAHSAEFLSGILFGVAAAALIAAIQEFVNSGRREKRDTHARPRSPTPTSDAPS